MGLKGLASARGRRVIPTAQQPLRKDEASKDGVEDSLLIVIRLLQVVALSFLVAGCFGPSFDYIRVDPVTVDDLRDQVPVYTENDIQGSEYALIQPLSATSCKNKLWDPSPTQEDATDQLRVKAAHLGGNGLLNVTCEAPGGTSLITNCWSSLTCHAAAIKVTR
jgi:hypothetical protein